MIEISFSYRPLFKLNILHNYYVNSLTRDITLKPVDSTIKLAQRLGLILKETDGEYILMAEPAKLEGLHLQLKKNVITKFTYLLYSENPYFLNFTETPAEINNLMFYFSNNSKGQIGGSGNLHSTDFASEGNRYEVNSQFLFEAIDRERLIEIKDDAGEVVFSKSLEQSQRLVIDNTQLPIGLYEVFENNVNIKKSILYSAMPVRKPIGIVDISFSGSIKNQMLEMIEAYEFPSFNYKIQFNSRTTYWRYLLVSKYNSSLKNSIIDSGVDSFKFNGPKEVRMKNGKDAFAFISEVPLSLKQIYDWKFQLKLQGSGFTGAKIIMDRLPLASPEILKSEQESDELKFFSEIIVYI